MYNKSPLRYPGGKTKLYSYIEKIISFNNLNDATYVEPFAGGCGVALKLLLNQNVENIIINDFDHAIYSFWYSVLNYADDFCERIHNEKINMDSWYKYRSIYQNRTGYSTFDLGYATFFLNRTNYSGIICGGVLGGEKQDRANKIDCRFNKQTLITKIMDINACKDHISLFEKDATNLIKDVLPQYPHTITYFDPPYVKKGKQLYQNYFSFEDHILLKSVIANFMEQPWIVTYDTHPEIEELYSDYYQEPIEVGYSAGKTKKGNELAIFSHDLISPNIVTEQIV